MDKNIIFKKEDNRYKLFFIEGKKELDMGVSFITDHNIEDYPILVIESIDGRVSHYKPCKNVVVQDYLLVLLNLHKRNVYILMIMFTR